MDRPGLTRIEPLFFSRIWGSRSLAPLFPEKTALAEPIGEAWLTARECRIGSGAFAGMTLQQAWQRMGASWRGSRHAADAEFPLLLKFIFPADKLSIQVHPDDAYVARHEAAAGGRGKTEMWHVVSADPGAAVLIGLRKAATRDIFIRAAADHKLEELFERWPVRPGDSFFLPAGTPHTIGPGMILCEVQQYSDVTYRVYDYGRVDAAGKPRELHLEKALDVIRFDSDAGGRTKPVDLSTPDMKRTLLAACHYFAAERWDADRPAAWTSEGESFQIAVVLAGTGTLEDGDSRHPYKSGDTWFVPAGIARGLILPGSPTSILVAYVPDMAALRKTLSVAGVSPTAREGILFE